jgi:hypothetical protein
VNDFFFVAAIFAAFAYVAALAHAVIGLKRELDQAIADFEKRINDRENRKKDCP